MPRGKKFDAAEKHFEKKRLQLWSNINHLNKRIDELNEEIKKKNELIIALVKNNEELDNLVKDLTNNRNLSDEELKKLAESRTSAKQLFAFIQKFSGIYGLNGRE
jgi:uncharacterized coiled-coil DUF342 family protein